MIDGIIVLVTDSRACSVHGYLVVHHSDVDRSMPWVTSTWKPNGYTQVVQKKR